MSDEQYYELPEFAAILSFVDAIFAEINIGLLIYHVENPGEIRSARLIYANKQASACTGTDLRPRLGQPIFEAFPRLIGTEVPRAILEVANDQRPRRLGVVGYEDEQIRPGAFATRVFPMPHGCVGVLFEKVDDSGVTAD
jgi:hypothetical protein